MFEANEVNASIVIATGDDLMIEGKEIATVTLNASEQYNRGTFTDSFQIIDRAAVKEILFNDSKSKKHGTNLQVDVP